MLVISLPLSLVVAAITDPPLALPGCQEKCGNLIIPYPFGVGKGCFKGHDNSYHSYQITCAVGNSSSSNSNSSSKAYVGTGDIEILEMSLDPPEIIVSSYYAFQCFNSSGAETLMQTYWMTMGGTPFTFSATRNKFITIGCDTMANIGEYVDNDFMSGCMSLCGDMKSVRNGSCSGIGCCQTSIPYNLKRFDVAIGSLYNHTRIWQSNPCSFAVLADQNWFTFKLSDLSVDNFNKSTIPVVMDWAIGNQTCETAVRHKKSYACGPNSYCSNSTNGPGYGCFCTHGFQGNPYLPRGCQDIDECEKGYNNSCSPKAICTNLYGSYNCSCPQGYYGDGWINGSRCTRDQRSLPLISIILDSLPLVYDASFSLYLNSTYETFILKLVEMTPNPSPTINGLLESLSHYQISLGRKNTNGEISVFITEMYFHEVAQSDEDKRDVVKAEEGEENLKEASLTIENQFHMAER
ncbi:hypothetical protein NE237_024094 [Protea cynaroides]|uniref:EGF-like domain-containing protein n=1 Tax=Protea cynaroides TaxID=273540 RepID=A0A9Q0HE80_9MAGN|nr:hypothetical protein NE237_024094 [Protea cynaroides]